MRAPAFQMYARDWLSNVKLRRCSPAARGAWIDVMCLMHGSDEYGVLRWPLTEIASVANVPPKLLRELAARDVLKGAESGAVDYVYTPRHGGKDGETVVLVTTSSGPCWYCSRLVRDDWIRRRRGNNTQFDSDNQPPKRAPKHTPNQPPKGGIGERQGDGPASAFASATSLNSKASSKAIAPAELLPDVEPETLADWLTVRKAKRAPLTPTAVRDLRKEATKAGLSLQDVVTLCCSRNWVSFKASFDWQGKAQAAPNSAPMSHKDAERKKFFDSIHGKERDDNEPIDITPDRVD